MKLWADMETFDLQGNKCRVPPFARVRSQIESLSPSADTILIYIYQTTMSKPGERAADDGSMTMYSGYLDWLKQWHPEMLNPVLLPTSRGAVLPQH